MTARIVAARRTPIGTAGHGLADVTAPDLAALPIAAVVADLGSGAAARVDEVILGNTMGPGGNIARVAALTAGLGHAVPAMTVDRQCASGLAAIDLGSRGVRDGGLVVAGGVESASTAPWRFWPPAGGEEPRRYARAPFAPAGEGDPEMAEAADDLADERAVTRARQDAYAARSHQRAIAAWSAGCFTDELIAVGELRRDERPREGLTVERLARLRPLTRPDGSALHTVTAGNSCGINDGAAAVVLADDAAAQRAGWPGLRVLGSATAGVDPRQPGRGLVPAVVNALAQADVTLRDLDVIEINEAFSGQVLACCDELGLDEHRVCREGGALALGHPWGASGAVLVVRLFSQLVRGNGGRYGLAAIAAGGGQGVAMVVEACR